MLRSRDDSSEQLLTLPPIRRIQQTPPQALGPGLTIWITSRLAHLQSRSTKAVPATIKSLSTNLVPVMVGDRKDDIAAAPEHKLPAIGRPLGHRLRSRAAHRQSRRTRPHPRRARNPAHFLGIGHEG